MMKDQTTILLSLEVPLRSCGGCRFLDKRNYAPIGWAMSCRLFDEFINSETLDRLKVCKECEEEQRTRMEAGKTIQDMKTFLMLAHGEIRSDHEEGLKLRLRIAKFIEELETK